MACDLEDLDLISAVWILACNDENHLITFEGIRKRLGQDEHFDIERLVLSRRELFRPGAPPGELEDWKAAMLTGKRLPFWIREVTDESERIALIERLGQKDVFRSQFRAKRGASQSEVQVLTWGLDHIDRIRKSRLAVHDASAKSWQMWLVFAVGVANIVATTALALTKSNDAGPKVAVVTDAQPCNAPDLARKAAQGR